MRVHFVQHVPFETPGMIEPYLREKGIAWDKTQVFDRQPWPDPERLDVLIVLGGPMGAQDEREFPWLKDEKECIERVIKAGKKVMGICLGAQLIADILGAKVNKNRFPEIGWFELYRSPQVEETFLGAIWPQKMTAFHWHGDTFEIPAGARRIARSEACENQGFVLDDRILAFQFHLEITPDGIDELLNNDRTSPDGSKYVQSGQAIKENSALCTPINRLMAETLDAFLGLDR